MIPRLALRAGPWFIAVGLLLAACAGEGRTGGGASQSAQGLQLAAPEIGGSTAGPQAAVDQVLRIAGAPPVTLDPALVRDTGSSQYVVELFSGLVKLDADLNVIGDLAESWEVLGAGDTYRFSLRPSLSFADAKTLTSEDVRYSLIRALSPQVKSSTSLSYLGDIRGAAEYKKGAVQRPVGISIPDARTVELRLTGAAPFFLYKLTYPVSFIVDARQTSKPDWYAAPNSSGPFRLASWRPGEQIVLERNDRYHSPPRLERVQIELIGGSEALLRYETGELDIAGIGGGDVDRFRDSADAFSDDYQSVPQFTLHYLGFNSRVPPFDDLHVRRAFAMAIDVEKIVRVSLRGHAVAANGVLPAGFPGHDPTRALLPYDPAEARAELARSAYGGASNLPDVVLLMPGSGLLLPSYLEAALFLIKQNLGVEVTVQSLEWADFLEELDRPDGEHQIFTLGWSADYPDPHNFIDLLFHSQSAENAFNYSNPAVDALIERARATTGLQPRFDLYREAEQIVIADAPLAPLWFSVDHLLVAPRVRDFKQPASNQEWMSAVWIADDL